MVTIQDIRKLSGAGVFAEIPPASSAAFLKFNLIYGFNGSGKTTLSRIFGSLEAGALDPELPEGIRFEIALSDGSVLKSSERLDRLKGKVLVFNADFQEKNLQWKRGFAQPIFIVGEQQADAVRALDDATARLEVGRAKSASVEGERRAAQQRLDIVRRDAAREISEALGLGRRYIATNLEADYARRSFLADVLPQQEVPALHALVGQSEALDRLDTLNVRLPSLKELCDRAKAVLAEVIGDLKISDFNAHPSMIGWAEAGLSYHQSLGLKQCLFCGGTLDRERLVALREVINNRYAEISTEINLLLTQIQALAAVLASWRIPSKNDVSSSIRGLYSSKTDEMLVEFESARKLMEPLAGVLERKKEELGVVVLLPEDVSPQSCASSDERIRRGLRQINELIGQHNAEREQFGQMKEEAAERLKRHYLGVREEGYRLAAQQAASAEEASVAHQTTVQNMERQVGQLAAEVRAHGPAADVITKGVQEYLGRGDLDVVAVEGGFQLRRGGRPVKGALSEGEKSAIAFCYFLSTIKAERRKLQELIVVVDDPVSSLDSRALNYSFNVLKARLGGALQLFVLTHNLQYMNQTKKWLKSRSRPKEGTQPTAAILYIDPQRSDTGAGASRITSMPKHLRDWDSEYHYLFDLIDRLIEKPDEMGGYVYLMPNAVRKVLEVFLAFKRPGNDGLASKVEAVSAEKEFSWDPIRLRAIDSLVQVESHADSVDEMMGLSELTVEEIYRAADAAMYFIRIVDPVHYERMKKACRA